jgi:hypothetical protein
LLVLLLETRRYELNNNPPLSSILPIKCSYPIAQLRKVLKRSEWSWGAANCRIGAGGKRRICPQSRTMDTRRKGNKREPLSVWSQQGTWKSWPLLMDVVLASVRKQRRLIINTTRPNVPG